MTAGDLKTHTSILSFSLVPGGVSLFTRAGREAVGLNLSRVSAPRKEAPFPCGYEDGDKIPDEPSPQPPRTFFHRAQQSHSSHRPTRLLSWWPALLAPRFPPVAMKAILLSLEHSSVFLSQNFCRV